MPDTLHALRHAFREKRHLQSVVVDGVEVFCRYGVDAALRAYVDLRLPAPPGAPAAPSLIRLYLD